MISFHVILFAEMEFKLPRLKVVMTGILKTVMVVVKNANLKKTWRTQKARSKLSP